MYSIQLSGYKKQEVQTFVNEVRRVLCNLCITDIKDKAMMFDWLFEKFKGLAAIAPEIRSIRKSKADSRKRTWKYLWSAINCYLEHSNEDANQAVLL